MTDVAARELRNDTAGVLRRVQAGEDVVITVRGAAIARLVPVRSERRQWMPKAELISLLATAQADPGLTASLRAMAGGPDDLPDLV